MGWRQAIARITYIFLHLSTHTDTNSRLKTKKNEKIYVKQITSKTHRSTLLYIVYLFLFECFLYEFMWNSRLFGQKHQQVLFYRLLSTSHNNNNNNNHILCICVYILFTIIIIIYVYIYIILNLPQRHGVVCLLFIVDVYIFI